MTTASLVSELLSMVSDTKADAEAAQEDIKDKKYRLDEIEDTVTDNLDKLDNILSELEELDYTIQELANVVQDFNNEF